MADQKKKDDISVEDVSYMLSDEEMIRLLHRYGYVMDIELLRKEKVHSIKGCPPAIDRKMFSIGEVNELVTDKNSWAQNYRCKDKHYGRFSALDIADKLKISPVDLLKFIEKSDIIGEKNAKTKILLIGSPDLETIQAFFSDRPSPSELYIPDNDHTVLDDPGTEYPDRPIDEPPKGDNEFTLAKAERLVGQSQMYLWETNGLIKSGMAINSETMEDIGRAYVITRIARQATQEQTPLADALSQYSEHLIN